MGANYFKHGTPVAALARTFAAPSRKKTHKKRRTRFALLRAGNCTGSAAGVYHQQAGEPPPPCTEEGGVRGMLAGLSAAVRSPISPNRAS
ncbi:hypothetical protein AZ19_3069 [Bordetella bronchiseptica E012]|uniref:Uncharacterized protein n=1 Tax=Bordetella bronchiseptica 00-P-2796 TaxID=1331199 RepID=A0ABR4RF37_BORBO|nr:hypothetical protein L490_2825 [Bordetella bronchiseptica 00-P-2796]KCV59317.1 hypothetical protein L493_2926 [Bordetella bronchiseptica 99-R-0433]KDB94488.1 hypothetical protein AZ23_3125 [Bordetella bronchiseptica E010]KDC00118.1 hypothetical protein AZ18_3166 [Bordetella bronchiseptica D993]KDC02990.1 hypothetical protein AZ19_3069 [Bordetella bronchiseptica E012]KDC11924.1 hypothetical protein AZ24_3023 [Bordetella bronchiseptica E013]KDD32327.1 hypothetical protein L527_3031 [Bordetel